MTKRALNPQQLQMFMTPDELVDQTNKFDSTLYDVYEDRGLATPRDQWERPGTDAYGDDRSLSLRDGKLRDVEAHHLYQERFAHDSPATMPPVNLQHRIGKQRPVLYDGHHRLAVAERARYPHIPVVHHYAE